MSERVGDFGDSSPFAPSVHRGKWADATASPPAAGCWIRGEVGCGEVCFWRICFMSNCSLSSLTPHGRGRGLPAAVDRPPPSTVRSRLARTGGGRCGIAVMFGSCPLVLHLRTAHRRPSSSRSPPPPLCLKAKQNCAPSLLPSLPSLHVPHRVLSGCRSICGT